MTFTEIADRVWLADPSGTEANVTVVGGTRGLAVVDTRGSAEAGRELATAVRRLAGRAGRTAADGDVVAVVNTHGHAEHCRGNEALRAEWPGAVVHAHEDAGLDTDHTFSSVRVLDLGDRALELLHPGRAHTAGDLLVRVPDADVLVVGDLVADPGPPSFGEDSWPMEWPLTLDVVLGLATPRTLVVPGHGAVVDRDFVEEQRNTIGIVAETVRDLAARGVPASEALAAADQWPWSREHLATAVARAYAHLPRSQKRLPLV